MRKPYESIFEPEPELIAELDCTVLEFESYILYIYTSKRSKESTLLQEAGLPGHYSLGKQYSADKHSAHTAKGQKHLHVYAGQNQIFALNIDGTAHDDSHQTPIPGVVAKGIQRIFPDWTIPPFIETATLPEAMQRLHG